VGYLSDAPRRKVLLALPEPVDERLEWLIRVARAAQVQASRSQVIAALIASAPTDPSALAGVVQHYLGQLEQNFSHEHPGTDLPEVHHVGAKRGDEHWSKRHARSSPAPALTRTRKSKPSG
jgi:hypothetical protein